MHDSMNRLLTYARDKTQGTREPIKDFTDLGLSMGVSSAVMTNWKSRGISKQGALQAERMYGCSATWVLDGTGARDRSSNDDSATPQIPSDATPVNWAKVKVVWVVGKASGGALPERIWTDADYPVGVTDEYGEVASTDPHAFITKVFGPSMIPVYTPGNYALVEPGTEPEIEDDVLVRLRGGETMIKRLLSRRDGYRFGSYNDPQVLHFEPDEVTWVYYIAHPVPRRKIRTRM